MYKIILASGSPRRKEIMEQVGIPFTVMISSKEEVYHGKEPVNIVKDLASMKANDIADREGPNTVIIGCDTVVSFHNQVMGKPKDEEDAKRMLHILQGNVHEVFTGVSLIIKDEIDGEQKDKEINFAVETRVYVNPMTERQIDEYVRSREPMDKAGAYAIQGKFAAFINKIEGDYYNVVGLPIAKLYELLVKEEVITD